MKLCSNYQKQAIRLKEVNRRVLFFKIFSFYFLKNYLSILKQNRKNLVRVAFQNLVRKKLNQSNFEKVMFTYWFLIFIIFIFIL